MDLSDNPIGDRAFEILWKVYGRSPEIYLPRVQKCNSTSSDDEYDTDDMGDESDELEVIYEKARRIKIQSKSPHTTPLSGSKTDLPTYSYLELANDVVLQICKSSRTRVQALTASPSTSAA